jgi:hypothetical protein
MYDFHLRFQSLTGRHSGLWTLALPMPKLVPQTRD